MVQDNSDVRVKVNWPHSGVTKFRYESRSFGLGMIWGGVEMQAFTRPLGHYSPMNEMTSIQNNFTP